MHVTHGDPGMLDADLVPQAEIRLPADGGSCGLPFVEGIDDLGHYTGMSLVLDDGMPFTVKRYRGLPVGLFTVYFARDGDMARVGAAIARVVAALGVADADVVWRRPDDPDR